MLPQAVLLASTAAALSVQLQALLHYCLECIPLVCVLVIPLVWLHGMAWHAARMPAACKVPCLLAVKLRLGCLTPARRWPNALKGHSVLAWAMRRSGSTAHYTVTVAVKNAVMGCCRMMHRSWV